MNEIRKKMGLKPFRLHSTLIKAAQSHSDEMAKYGRFNHFGKNGSTWADRCKAAGYKSANLMNTGENIGQGQRDEEQIVADWMKSPGHRKQIVDPKHVHIGSGLAGTAKYWTTDFCSGDPDNSSPQPDVKIDREFFNFI